MTRNFSLKVNSHLKMLCYLINNLIKSDDHLNLLEEKLTLPYTIRKINYNSNNQN